MPSYHYSALTPAGTSQRGEETATSAEELRQALQGRGLLVQRIQEQRAGFWVRRARVRPEAFLLFNQEFIALNRAGLTIPEALKLAMHRPESPVLGQALTKVEQEVRNGALLSEACSRYPEAFDGLYLAALKTGEKTGQLAPVLEKYQANLRQRVDLALKTGQALAYPAFLLITLVVILAVLFAFVLPRFVKLYADFDAKLPLATRILIGMVENLPYVAPVAIMLAVAGGYGMRRWLTNSAAQVRFDEFKEKLPLIGGIFLHNGVAQTTRTLATLLAGGTPLVTALRLTAESLTSRFRGLQLNQVARRVAEGSSLAIALREARLLPVTGVRMVEVGEATGGLENMLNEVAGFHEEMLTHTLTRIMALIEPILMLLIGVFVGGIIIIMYLPIFYIVDVIR